MKKKEMPLGLRFAVIGRCFRTVMDDRLREHDVTGVQFSILRELRRHEEEGAGELYQRDLENVSHVTHPTMTEIIKRLERKGYIECRKSEGDRRHKCILSTARAKALCSEVSAAEDYAAQRILCGLTEEEISALERLLEKILVNVDMIKGENRE